MSLHKHEINRVLYKTVDWNYLKMNLNFESVEKKGSKIIF